jgi:hypothetical protein
VLSVKTFGAKGDGVTDDAPAIQKAIDSISPDQARALFFPAGVYLVNTSLTLWRSGGAARLLGEGMEMTTLVAGAHMTAVLVFPGSQPNATDPGTRSNGHEIQELTFNARGLADFAVYAPALTRSRFTRAGFHDGRVAGLYVGSGWINEFFQCSFSSSPIGGLAGLYLDNQINSVNVLDSMFEAGAGELGIGLIVNSGAMVRIEGNCFEGLGGPGIIANQLLSLSVKANYFEVNNMKPENFHFVTNETGTPTRQSLCADIVVDGDYGFAGLEYDNSLSISQFAPGAGVQDTAPGAHGWRGTQGKIRLDNHAPCRSVTIEGNFHNPRSDTCPGGKFYGTYAAGAIGLRSQSNDCDRCAKNATCAAVGTGVGGPSPGQPTLDGFEISLNTGVFANVRR